MKIASLFHRNRIEMLTITELQEEEIKLKSRINRLRKEIDRIEREKKLKFSEGVGGDLIKKKMLAQELKQLDMTAKLKVRNFLSLHKQYMFISNLVIIKRYQTISPEAVESALIRVNLSGKGFESVVDDLNQVFALDLSDSDQDLDEAEKQMFEVWTSVETGSLGLDEAKDLFSIEKDIEKAINESEG